VPDELLHHVFGPQPYSAWWLWWGLLLLLIVLFWYATVFVWTLPSHRLRRIPGARRVHGRLIRHRFARRVRDIAAEHHAGRTSAPAACAAISRTLRSFVHQVTGVPAQYLHVGEFRDTAQPGLAAAAPLLDQLGDAQFNAEARVDVGEIGNRAQELIRSWT
jgi:hypothetical protein